MTPQDSPEQIRFLDDLARRAWPTLEAEVVDGWELRAAGGTTRRANSVWTQGFLERGGVASNIEAVEAFYGDRELPATFYVSPGSKPHGLDAFLGARGYEVEGVTLVHTVRLTDMVERAGGAEDVSVELVEELDDGWLAAHFRCARRSGQDARNRAAIISRIASPAAFASAVIGNEVVAVATGVLDRGWLGISNVVTDRQFRRRGASRTLLGLLAGWAERQGAEHAYLGVEEDNTGAIALYRGLGMEMAYRYHYRVKLPAGPHAPCERATLHT